MTMSDPIGLVLPFRAAIPRVRSCRVCGCDDNHACAGGCAWAPGEKDLCTNCVGVAPRDEQLAELDAAMGARVIHSSEEIRMGGSTRTSSLIYRVVAFTDITGAEGMTVGLQEIQWEGGEILTSAIVGIDDEPLDQVLAALTRARDTIRARKAAGR